MGSVNKDSKNNTFYIRYDVPTIDGTRDRRQVGGFKSEKEARNALVQIETELRKNSFSPIKRILLKDFIKIWEEAFVDLQEAATRSFYTTNSKHIINDKIAEKFTRDLTTVDINTFYSRLNNTSLSSTTKVHIHKTLSSILKYASEWKYIDANANPIQNAVKPKLVPKEMNYWTAEEAETYLEVLKDSMYIWHVKMSLLTGMRLGEICALNIADVNLEKGIITVRTTMSKIYDVSPDPLFRSPKSGKARIIPMLPEVEQMIKERIEWIDYNREYCKGIYNTKWDGYLSVNASGDLLTTNNLSLAWRRIMARHPEIKKVRFHDLRHSCASYLIKMGVPLVYVQRILGHSDIKITQKYIHQEVDDIRSALMQIPSITGGGSLNSVSNQRPSN